MDNDIQIRDLSREQKEKYIREYFKNGSKEVPNLSNFSFTTRSKINDIPLKFIGAICFLTEFREIDKKKESRKDRTFFFVFLKGDVKRFNKDEFTSELYDICTYFNKVSIIKINFMFENGIKTYQYTERGFISSPKTDLNSSFNFVKQPDDYINQFIDNRKHLEDCYSAFIGNKDGGLNFITNDYYDTRHTFNLIMDAIEKENKKIVFVHGPAGSGKTILAMRLLGLYKQSQMLIINEYFDSELHSLFLSKNNSDIRFFNHRGSDSEQIAEEISHCNMHKVPIREYKKEFNKFIYKKYWTEEGKSGKAPKEFWDTYNDKNRDDYASDFEEFGESLKDRNFQPCEILIIDEGQRLYQRTIEKAYLSGLTTVIFGDSQQKINPDTDDLILDPDREEMINTSKDLDKFFKQFNKNDYKEIPMQYPIRIPNNALEKINYVLGKSKKTTYRSLKDMYPIVVFDRCEDFLNNFNKDRESQKFICSYQDIWRHEKEEKSVLKRKVTQVRFLDYVIKFTFDDGYEAYPPKSIAYKISDSMGIRILDMPNHYLNVSIDHEKTKRYQLQFHDEEESQYYGETEIIKLDPSVKSIGKEEKKDTSDKLLVNPNLKRRMFSPFELISREVRNIYLYLPKTITMLLKENRIIDKGKFGKRFYNEDSDTNYLLNQLYVLMTRATRRIYIYCEDKVLTEYFKNQLNQYEQENTLFF